MKSAVILLVALLFALSACVPEEDASDAADEAEGPSPAAAVAADGGETADEESAAAADAATDDATDNATDDAAQAGDETGEADPAEAAAVGERPPPRARGVRRRVPEDVEIGPLEDRIDGPGLVLAAVDELFVALSEERVPSDLLAEESRGMLEDRLSFMIDRVDIAAEVAVGELVRTGEETYRTQVVARGKAGGRTTGEIYVAKSEGAWYISDILVDFTRIDPDEDRPIFEPGAGGPTLL